MKRQHHVQIVSSGLDLISVRGRPAPARGSLVSATCSLLILAAGAHQALAQQQSAGAGSSGSTPSEEQLETVTVTGVRAAIENAISVKQSSDMIVEAVSAEDIGKLPDTSIAESISRLPGLTSQRSDGRASDISIRGTDRSSPMVCSTVGSRSVRGTIAASSMTSIRRS